MNDHKQVTEQRSSENPLLFPVRFFREIVKSIKYIYMSLTLSMRKKISFDYGVMFALTAIVTFLIFGVGFTLYHVNSIAGDVVDELFVIASTKDKGFYELEEVERQIEKLAIEYGVAVRIEKSSSHIDQEAYVTSSIANELMDDDIFDLNLPQLVGTFFNNGILVTQRQRYFTVDDNATAYYTFRVAQNLKQSNTELGFLLLVLLVSQIIGLTIISFVGSFRLRRVFRPIYNMTRMAEKISINDMDAKLDVTKAEYELKDLALTFNDMLGRIQTDYDKQKRFVSDVSHELRTPISIVNGYARMLDRWGKKDEAILEESIDAIKSESKNMQTLVENLLTLVRSDNHTLKFEREFFKIDEMAKDIIKDMEMVDEGKHIFSNEIEAGALVCLDYAKTKQTIRIFMDNAIKYTPVGGHIKLVVKSEVGTIWISVIDTGIGISKKDLPFLFDRFYRSDESRTRETGGHGLGLSIAKAMVIGQKGRLRVKSKEHEGSEFIIILPMPSSHK